MHMVVVGGGPTGVEYAGELHDFLIVRADPLVAMGFIAHFTGRSHEMVPRHRG